MVVPALEFEQGKAQFVDGAEVPHPEEVFLERADEAFGVLAPGTPDPSAGGYYTNWHTQVYSVTPRVSEGLVLGSYDLWYLTGKKEGPLELHLKASRDSKSWFDVDYPQPMLPRGQMGQWDAGMV